MSYALSLTVQLIFIAKRRWNVKTRQRGVVAVVAVVVLAEFIHLRIHHKMQSVIINPEGKMTKI